jgi:hypothetical protein
LHLVQEGGTCLPGEAIDAASGSHYHSSKTARRKGSAQR